MMGYIYAVLAVFFWSFNSLIAKGFSHTLTPLELSVGRWVIALLILLPFTYKELKKHYPFFKKHLIWIINLGISGVVLENTLMYVAGHSISASDIGILSVIGPVFMVLLSAVFLKTKITLLHLSGMLLAFFGVLIVVTKGDFSLILHLPHPFGNMMIILNAFALAVYSFLQINRPKNISQTALLSATIIAGLVILIPLLFIFTPIHRLSALTSEDYGVFLYLGVFNSILAYIFWNSALSTIGQIKTGIIYYLFPIFIMIEAYLFFHAPILPSQIIGGICVILGITLVSFKKSKPSKN